MTLNEFINHIKHNSLEIDIFIEGQFCYCGSIGAFKTHLKKEKYGDYKIQKIEPLSTNLEIFLERK